MKAIVLTNAPITAKEKELLRETSIFKLALNHHAEELRPDKRIIADYILPIICSHFKQKVISVRDKFVYVTNRVEYPDIEYKGSTIVSAVDYLILNKFTSVLLIADNTVHSESFKEAVKKEINNLKDKITIFQYSNGNFDLPVKEIKDFV